jgi:hypothetical protein
VRLGIRTDGPFLPLKAVILDLSFAAHPEIAKYDRMPAEMAKALAPTVDIPVDVEPVFSFKDEVK